MRETVKTQLGLAEKVDRGPGTPIMLVFWREGGGTIRYANCTNIHSDDKTRPRTWTFEGELVEAGR